MRRPVLINEVEKLLFLELSSELLAVLRQWSIDFSLGPGEWAELTLCFPAAPGPAHPSPPSPSAVTAIPITVLANGMGKKILVVRRAAGWLQATINVAFPPNRRKMRHDN